VLDGGGEELSCGEDLEVLLGMPAPAGSVDDFPGGFVPRDLFEGERGAQEILRQAAAAFGIVGGDGFFSGVEVEAAVGPAEELVQFGFADEFFASEGGEEAVSEELFERFDALDRHLVEVAVLGDQAGGGDNVKMGVEAEVIAERLHSGDGGELAFREIEPGAEPVLQAGDGFVEEEGEEFASFAEDSPERFGHGEDELAVRDVEADVVGDPVASLFDLALVAGRAEVAGFAGEGEELFVAAVRALEAGEAGGEITAFVELVDYGDGVLAEGAVGSAVAGFVFGQKWRPSVVDDLPEWRGSGAAWAVDGRHACS